MLKPCTIFFLNHLSSYLNSLADALSQMGHRICYQTSWKFNEIEEGIRFFKPDILITVGIDRPMFDPSLDVIPELCKKYRMLHIYWATEDKIHFDAISVPFIKRVKPDVIWTLHPDCIEKYNAMGLKADYFNFAFNPSVFPAKLGSTEEIYDITFIGTTHLETRTLRYESLRILLYPLIKSGIPVQVWGLGWKENEALLEREFGASVPDSCLQGYASYKYTALLYRQSRIVLGVQNAEDQVSQRTFEILGTGAFMIATRTQELERLFRDGEELVLSSSPEETVELVRYYLKNDEERQRIGRNARAAVLANHTFKHRLDEVWPKVYDYK